MSNESPTSAVDAQIKEIELREKQRAEQNSLQLDALRLRKEVALTEKAELDASAARRAEANALASDLEQRTYIFYDGVDEVSCKQAIRDLNSLSRRFPGEPLTVVINSPGGIIYHGLAVYDHIRALSERGHFITTVTRGIAASMGGILLQAGDLRLVGPTSDILIHENSGGFIGQVSERQDSTERARQLWEKLTAILASKSTMTAEEIREKAYKFEWWLSADEAVELGFADAIG